MVCNLFGYRNKEKKKKFNDKFTSSKYIKQSRLYLIINVYKIPMTENILIIAIEQ